MSARLVILNDVERPEARMIAIVRDGKNGREWTYLSNYKALSAYRCWTPVTREQDHIPIETFGVRASYDGAYLHVDRVGPTRAAYPDGFPRDWQGVLPERTTIRTTVLNAALAALKAHATFPAPDVTVKGGE